MNAHLVSGLVLFGLTAAWYAAIGQRRFAAIDGHQAALAAAYERAERVSAEAAGMPDLERAAEELQRWADELRPHLHRDPAQPDLLLATQHTLKLGGLQIERLENLAPDAGIGRPNARIRATVSGPLTELFAALVAIENMTPPTRISELSWQRQGAGGSFRCELTVVQVWQEMP
ncbi:MAG: hypothetical protein MUC36_24955 [Planctomycetes bacterium]|jgi:hypothetical protein|nr:hypothetical protein [Planctomycetota bacterium]